MNAYFLFGRIILKRLVELKFDLELKSMLSGKANLYKLKPKIQLFIIQNYPKTIHRYDKRETGIRTNENQ